MDHAKLIKLIELADDIMSICGGDSWENECARPLKDEYHELHSELEEELGFGYYSPEKIQERKAEEQRKQEFRKTEILRSSCIDCPHCRCRVTLMGLSDHCRDVHNDLSMPRKFDAIKSYIFANCCSSSLVKATRPKIKPKMGAMGLYKIAKAAKRGESVICPTCKNPFVKVSDDQCFCAKIGTPNNRGVRTQCKDRFHNKIKG